MRGVDVGGERPEPMFLMRDEELTKAERAVATAGVHG